MSEFERVTPQPAEQKQEKLSPEEERREQERYALMEQLGGEYFRDLVRYCERQLSKHRSRNPKTDAEDFAQEVMLKAWQWIDRVDPKQNLRGFLFRMARNKMIDASRKLGRDRVATAISLSSRGPDGEGRSIEEEMPGEDPRDGLIAKLDAQRVEALLAPPEAEIFNMEALYGFTPEEIAEKLKIPENEVNNRLNAAYEHLAQRLVQ